MIIIKPHPIQALRLGKDVDSSNFILKMRPHMKIRFVNSIVALYVLGILMFSISCTGSSSDTGNEASEVSTGTVAKEDSFLATARSISQHSDSSDAEELKATDSDAAGEANDDDSVTIDTDNDDMSVATASTVDDSSEEKATRNEVVVDATAEQISAESTENSFTESEDQLAFNEIGVVSGDAVLIDDDASDSGNPAPQILTEEETLMTGIWERTIDGVVLITVGSDSRSVFSTDGAGAGWFWDDKGHIVTNYHVVRTSFGVVADPITVETYDGDEYDAEFIGGDELSDIAVLRIDIDADDYTALTAGNSSALIPGMTAIALGHPFGPAQGFSITHGIISALGRSIQSTPQSLPIPGVIQTDADMNPGNSGGPLLNSSGEVIGVNTQIRSNNNTDSGVGFAVPINLVNRVVPSLIESGKYDYPYMGIRAWPLNAQARKDIGIADDQRGLYIGTVDGPAEAAGIMPDSGSQSLVGDGDIIVSVDGVVTNNLDELREYLILEANPGDQVKVEVVRDGETIFLDLTLASRSDN